MKHPRSKIVLLINLEKEEFEVKTFTDIHKYIGGVGLGLKLFEMYQDLNPLILSVGPLNGFFPFCSKTCIVLKHEKSLEDIYLGGTLSGRFRFAGIDAILIYGECSKPISLDIVNTKVYFIENILDNQELGLPGKRSVINFDKNKLNLDGYFTAAETYLEEAFAVRNLQGITLTGTEVFSPNDFSKYQEIYENILSRKEELTVEQGWYPSCFNCPMSCGKSKVGEVGGNVLTHSLVACEHADSIYSDVGITFSSLNSLGYDYTHEDIENLPKLIEQTLRNIK